MPPHTTHTSFSPVNPLGYARAKKPAACKAALPRAPTGWAYRTVTNRTAPGSARDVTAQVYCALPIPFPYMHYLASFPGSHAQEREIEVVQAWIYIRVPGEPGNEATLLPLSLVSFPD